MKVISGSLVKITKVALTHNRNSKHPVGTVFTGKMMNPLKKGDPIRVLGDCGGETSVVGTIKKTDGNDLIIITGTSIYLLQKL